MTERKARHSFAALLVLALSGCGPSATVVMPFELTDADQAAIKAGVRASLRDPGSAEFGDMRATRGTDGAVSVCGWVNSKNGFVGYTGNQLFIGLLNIATHPSIFTLTAIGTPEQQGQMPIISRCKKAGITL
jgi:hypothetical protein